MSKIKHAPGVLCMTVNCILPSNNGRFVTLVKFLGMRPIRYPSGIVIDMHCWEIDIDLPCWSGLISNLPRQVLQKNLKPISGPSVDVTENETVGDQVSA